MIDTSTRQPADQAQNPIRAPQDYSRQVANPPQGPVPVSGVFPVGATLHLLETRLQAIPLCHIARISRHATPYAWA